MKHLMKALCAAGLLAATLNLPAQAEDKMSGGKMMDHKMSDSKMSGDKMGGKMMDHKMGGKMMSCPACKMMGSKMSGGDKMQMDHMMSMMSASEKKTMMRMSASEKALMMKAAKAGMMHGKMSGKMGKM